MIQYNTLRSRWNWRRHEERIRCIEGSRGEEQRPEAGDLILADDNSRGPDELGLGASASTGNHSRDPGNDDLIITPCVDDFETLVPEISLLFFVNPTLCFK